MSGYQVQRDALKNHARRVEGLKKKFDDSVGRFSANPGLALTNDDFSWAGHAITQAYINQLGQFFTELQHVSDALADTVTALRCAEANYSAAEATIEKSVDELKKQTDGLVGPRAARDVALYQNPIFQAFS